MKIAEKNQAIELRKRGWSLNEIKRKLGISKSSVSLWVRNIELTIAQKRELSKKGIKKEVIEKQRATRLRNAAEKRQYVINNARLEIDKVSKRELWLIGTALYWGEGAKTLRSGVQFSNSDPRAIQLMMQFFRRICNVPENKFRGHIHIHPHLNTDRARKFWHIISGIPLKQFYKISIQQSKASKKKKDSLPFGTLNIIICNTELFLEIKGWIEGISQIFENRSKK